MIGSHGLDLDGFDLRGLMNIGHSECSPRRQYPVDVLREPRDAVDGLIVFRQLGITSSQQKAHPSKTAQKLHCPLHLSEFPTRLDHGNDEGAVRLSFRTIAVGACK